MTNKQIGLFQETARKAIDDAHKTGLKQGAQAVCVLIREMVNDTSKSPDGKLDAIRAFCESSLSQEDDA